MIAGIIGQFMQELLCIRFTFPTRMISGVSGFATVIFDKVESARYIECHAIGNNHKNAGR